MGDYETALSKNFDKSFDRVLPVYLLPDPLFSADEALTNIITKAQAVISEKTISNYLDEAYMLQGKANFYQDLHFSAVEYFSYVANAFNQQTKRKLNAFNWKARSEIQLQKLEDAKVTVDSIEAIFPTLKGGTSESHATIAQFHIINNNYPEAIKNLELALKEQRTSEENDRWEYILGQLYQKEQKDTLALKFFNKVAKSNAPFDLYFNANLNKIRLESQLSGDTLNRHLKILALLKDDKNEGYEDQIYFKAAEIFLASKNYSQAEEYLLLSAAKSTNNTYQKGLSFLTIADLNFEHKNNYLASKLYYDSALTVLPKDFPDLAFIQRKVNNLSYLSERYIKVAFQDTLQMLATLPEESRTARINLFLGPEKVDTLDVVPSNKRSDITNQDNFQNVSQSTGFYFNSPAAISSGFTDFKRRWGNRPLEDNWRQSTKTNNPTSQIIAEGIANTKDSTSLGSSSVRSEEVQRYLSNIPITPAQKIASDQIIFNALFEIASFYQQELGDLNAAIKVFEEILRRFPANNKLENIYYSLFRAYEDRNTESAEMYKDLLIKSFPNSTFTKAILDPSANAKESERELKVQSLYNSVYTQFEEKGYENVIKSADSVLKEFPQNKIHAQFDYLKAIAIGRTHQVDTLLQVFNTMVETHAQDSIITPLVKEHIAYIQANIGQFRNREYALADFDINDPRFLAQNTVAPIVTRPVQPSISKPIDINAKNPPQIAQLDKTSTTTLQDQKTVPPNKEELIRKIDTNYIEPVKTGTLTNSQNQIIKDSLILANKAKPNVVTENTEIVDAGLYTTAPSSVYYFVISVDDASLTLSSSRFGIGQFNRSNYPAENLRHLLQELDEDQLIFVGNFADLASVKSYSARISNQMGSIMKIPANRYKTFIISKENFDKMNSRSRILQYITFFSTNIK